MLEKTVKKNNALAAMLESKPVSEENKEPKEKKPAKAAKKANPKSYERYRGRGGTKPMSYYLPDDIIKLLNVKAAKEGKTKSDLVLEGLKYVLKDELQEANTTKN